MEGKVGDSLVVGINVVEICQGLKQVTGPAIRRQIRERLRGEQGECPAKPPQFKPRLRMGNLVTCLRLVSDIIASHGWLAERGYEFECWTIGPALERTSHGKA